jgi:alpha-tubulin suppressor-like RCC1 family protein
MIINQQVNGGKWNSLGSYSFTGGVRYTVKVTSQPGPSSTCVDAVKFTYIGANVHEPPTAVIDFISPNPALPGAKVDLSGHGVDINGGGILAYSWRSSIDGALSTSATFNSSTLSTGQHTIYLKVQDGIGTWSTEAGASLEVTSPVPSLVPVSVDSGNRHSLALMNNGTVLAWGSNKEGALGLGASVDNSLIPVQVTGLTGVSAISAGDGHSLALMSDGTIRGWGQNIFGGIGSGDNLTHYTPVNVSGLSGVTAISAGGLYSIALKNDGTVWAWGKNDVGQLGDGTAIHRTTPVQVTGLTGVTAISAGQDHTVALKSDGTVWAWGGNDVGQLGDGTVTNRPVPVQVSGLTGVSAISSGEAHSLALLNNGTVKAWGANFFGELGDGSTTHRYTPVSVIGLTNVAAVSAGGYFSVGLKNDGTVWAWGSGIDGQTGDGTINIPRSTPVQVKGPGGIGYIDGVSAISSSQDHTLAPRINGTVWGWGYNGFGQLGDGTTTTRLTPVPATGL